MKRRSSYENVQARLAIEKMTQEIILGLYKIKVKRGGETKRLRWEIDDFLLNKKGD